MSEKPISEKELLVAIKDLLMKSGYLNKIKAEVRAKVTGLLQDRQSTGVASTPPTPTDEVLLVNELVREYLEWNGYLYTASVMMSEAAMPKDKRTSLSPKMLGHLQQASMMIQDGRNIDVQPATIESVHASEPPPFPPPPISLRDFSLVIEKA